VKSEKYGLCEAIMGIMGRDGERWGVIGSYRELWVKMSYYGLICGSVPYNYP
jgi:hypothetical protein